MLQPYIAMRGHLFTCNQANPTHCTLQKVVLHALDLVSLAQNGKPTLAVANSLHILHVMVKCIIETCSPSTLSMVFEVAPNLPPAVQGAHKQACQQHEKQLYAGRATCLGLLVQPDAQASYPTHSLSFREGLACCGLLTDMHQFLSCRSTVTASLVDQQTCAFDLQHATQVRSATHKQCQGMLPAAAGCAAGTMYLYQIRHCL